MPVKNSDSTIVPDAPVIPGLTFRRFCGEKDYPAMVAVIEKSKKEDRIEVASSVEEIANTYEHLVNCNPYQDMLLVEMHTTVIGYSRVWWHRELNGTLIYSHIAFLVPQWRNKGIRRAMLHYNEQRLRNIVADHSDNVLRYFEAQSEDTETHWNALLER
jgi:GNAT superfamily N-acetyltransferase